MSTILQIEDAPTSENSRLSRERVFQAFMDSPISKSANALEARLQLDQRSYIVDAIAHVISYGEGGMPLSVLITKHAVPQELLRRRTPQEYFDQVLGELFYVRSFKKDGVKQVWLSVRPMYRTVLAQMSSKC